MIAEAVDLGVDLVEVARRRLGQFSKGRFEVLALVFERPDALTLGVDPVADVFEIERTS